MGTFHLSLFSNGYFDYVKDPNLEENNSEYIDVNRKLKEAAV